MKYGRILQQTFLYQGQIPRSLDLGRGLLQPEPTCGSGSLLIKCELEMECQQKEGGYSCPLFFNRGGLENPPSCPPLKLFGQEYVPETWTMANMNMIIHDMEGQIEIGDTFKNPKFRAEKSGKLQKFDRVVAAPMWNQDSFTEADYDADDIERFPAGARIQRIADNLSPSLYIHTGDNETYRPIAEIGAVFDALESDARETAKALRAILKQLGI